MSKDSQQPEKQGLWNKPGGLREVIKLAAPLMITNGAWALMIFCDRLFLFKSSIHEFNAALPAGTLYWTAMSLFVGIAGYTNTFVAQYHGANRPDRIGASVWQGIRLAFYVTPIFAILILAAPFYFAATTKVEDVTSAQTIYFQILMLGCTSAIITSAQGAFFNGRGNTHITMAINIGAVLLNIFLDYVLILGKFGIPSLGIRGAAIATTVSSWVMVITFFVFMARDGNWKKFHLNSTWKHDSSLLGRMLKFGTPNGLPMLFEAITFHSLVKIVDYSFGTIKSAASTMVLSINQLAHFPLVGLGIACSIMVGQRVAQQKHAESKVAIRSALILGLAYCAVFGICYFVLPDTVIKLFQEMMPQDSAFFSIREVAVVLLKLAALYLILECLQLVFSGAIKGAGDTRFVLMVTIFSAIATLLAYFLARSAGLYAMWWVYIIQITIIGVACFMRYSGGKWKNLAVIETGKSVD